MKRGKFITGCFFTLVSFLPAWAQVNVLTYHNDNARTGANTNEALLTAANVNSNTFGKLFRYNVDGYVHAQPLYLSGLNIPGQGTRNVLFIATQHNSIYALDADSTNGPGGGVLWQTNLGTSAVTPTLEFGGRYGPYTDITNEVGITGTPVIDPASGTLYVDAFTHEGANYVHRLHALNITNGAERAFSPAVVAASCPGNGPGSVGGRVIFTPKQQIQRSALTLAGGVLYVCYSGFADSDPFHGWILGFNPTTLQQLTNYVFNSTPNGTTNQFGTNAGEGGIWMSGNGLASDANTNLYLEIGNGTFTATNGSGGTEFGDSFVKLTTTNGLAVADYFTPYNQATLALNDTDLGSSGLILLPDQPGPYPHLLVGGGKEGKVYLINRDAFASNNNHFNATGTVDYVVQTIPPFKAGRLTGTPAYFNGRVYFGGWTTNMTAFALNNGLLSSSAVSIGPRRTGFPGSTPSVSASGTSNGIVWALFMGNPGVLVAHNATNLINEIYNTTQAAGNRDALTNGVKFTVPTVANGKVYVGSQYSVYAFGLLGGNLAFSSANYSAVESGVSATITVSRTGGSAGAASVSYATIPGGTATPGIDYLAASGTLSWTNGETASKSFTITVIDDDLAEANETISLVLTNPSGAYLGPQTTATLTILEDGYEAWKFNHFGLNANAPLASDFADPDNDGIANLMEFALGSDPNTPGTEATITAAIVTNRLQLQLRRNTSATNLTYVVQTAAALDNWSDLMTWTAASGWVADLPGATASESASVGIPPDAYVSVTVADPSSLATAAETSRFYRLLVHR
jgi:hypothetical protein